MQNLLLENEFDLHLNELVSKTELHIKGFPLGLVLKRGKGNSEMAYYMYSTMILLFSISLVWST